MELGQKQMTNLVQHATKLGYHLKSGRKPAHFYSKREVDEILGWFDRIV